MFEMRDWRSTAASVIAACVLAACASKGVRTPAPVDDRSTGSRAPVQTAPVAVETPKVTNGSDNAGKPGYYTVRPGDTLIRIALDAGQNWRDVARWNNLENPNVIEVGQVLRIAPSASAVASASTAPQPPKTATPAASGPVAPAAPAASSVAVASALPSASGLPPSAPSGEDEIG